MEHDSAIYDASPHTHTHTHTHTDTHTHTHTHAPVTEWYMQEDLGDDKKTNWISETRDGLGGLIYVAQYKDGVLHWTHPTFQRQIQLIAVINILLTYRDWGLHNACWSRDKLSEIWHHVSYADAQCFRGTYSKTPASKYGPIGCQNPEPSQYTALTYTAEGLCNSSSLLPPRTDELLGWGMATSTQLLHL